MKTSPVKFVKTLYRANFGAPSRPVKILYGIKPSEELKNIKTGPTFLQKARNFMRKFL